MNYDAWESGDWWPNVIIGIIITATAYCAIPMIYRFLIHKKPLLKNNAIPLCILWSVIVCIIFQIIQYATVGNLEGISFAPAFFYCVINIAIVTMGKDHTVSTNETPAPINDSQNNSDTDTASIAEPESSIGCEKTENKYMKFGSFTISKQPSNKPKSKLSILLAIICIILIAGLGYLYNQNQQLKTSLKDTEATYDDLSSRYSKVTKYKGIAEFYLDNAVILKVGDKHYYHRMDCPKLGSDYSYLISNTEAAKGTGYKKCPYCFSLSAEEYADKELGSYAMDTVFDQLYE